MNRNADRIPSPRRAWRTVLGLLLLAPLALGAPAATAQSACCAITGIDVATGTVSSKVNSTQQVFQFKVANAVLLRSLRIGQSVWANFQTGQASLDGKTACCEITRIGAGPIPSPLSQSAARQNQSTGAAAAVPSTGAVGVPPSTTPQLTGPSTSSASTAGPGSQALAHVHVMDGLTLRPRAGLKIQAAAHITCMSSIPDCKGNFITPLVGQTDANGQATLASGPITRTCENNQHQVVTAVCSVSQVQVTGIDNKDEWGWEVDSIPGLPVTGTAQNGGTINLSGVTPKPMGRNLLDPQYGGSPQGNTSELLSWKGLNNSIGTVVFVPDKDALNAETPTMTLVAMRKVAGPLLRQGFDVYVGNYADGSRQLRQFDTEIANWIRQAYTLSGKKVHVMGVGVGGLLVRQALVDIGSLAAATNAWYSLDAPHKGLNFGSGEDSRAAFGCADYNRKVWGEFLPAHPFGQGSELDFNSPQCTCGVNPDYSIGEDPSKWHCVSNSQAHDAYFGALGWPPANIPHYAVAYGDVYTHSLMGDKETLINVDFSLAVNCPYHSKRLSRWKRDCVAGSRYLTVGDVNHQIRSDLFGKGGTSWNAGVCGNMEIKLEYQPAFVNIDSALAAAIEPVPTEGRGDCRYDYSGPLDSTTVTHWTDWAGNASNWDHRVLSDYLACKLVNWADSVEHLPQLRSCSSAPTIMAPY